MSAVVAAVRAGLSPDVRSFDLGAHPVVIQGRLGKELWEKALLEVDEIGGHRLDLLIVDDQPSEDENRLNGGIRGRNGTGTPGFVKVADVHGRPGNN